MTNYRPSGRGQDHVAHLKISGRLKYSCETVRTEDRQRRSCVVRHGEPRSDRRHSGAAAAADGVALSTPGEGCDDDTAEMATHLGGSKQ